MKIFRNRTVIGVLCILLALIICFGVTPLFSRSASEKTEIVRVTMDIKEGDEITAEMVQTVEVGAYNLPQVQLRACWKECNLRPPGQRSRICRRPLSCLS